MKIIVALVTLILIPLFTAAVELTVYVKGMRNDKGHVILGVYPDEETFSDPRAATYHRTDIHISKGEAIVEFNVVPGMYAIALFHDENDDQELEMAAGAIPREGWGFSRDALLTPTWPDFDDAVFEVGEKPVSQTITVQYSLLDNFQKVLPIKKLKGLLPKWPFE